MRQYLQVMADTLENGWDRPSRAMLDGKNVVARTGRKFARQMRLNLRGKKRRIHIPTTKPVSFHSIALELAAFIAAISDVREMNKAGLRVERERLLSLVEAIQGLRGALGEDLWNGVEALSVAMVSYRGSRSARMGN
jgi:thymidylate synthase